MHRNRLLSLIVLFALVLSPLAVFAQGGDEEMETFTAESGLFTFSYPKDWAVQESEDFPYGASLADSEETLEEVTSDEDTEADPGQIGANISLLPTDFLTAFGLVLEEDATFEDVAGAVLDLFVGDEADSEDDGMEATPEADDDEDMTLGELEVVEFESGAEAAIAPFTEKKSEGAIVVFMPADGVLGVMYFATAPGEFSDDLRDTALAIVESFEFTGTAEDLMPMMPDTSGESSDTSGLDGNALVDERCTVCHDRGRIDSKDKDEAGWTQTVDRMIGHGAQLDASERQAVIDYLVETH